MLGKKRTPQKNSLLGCFLASIAGAINAGAFFLIHQYTSHMTGILSLSADSFALGEMAEAFLMLGYILCFLMGAMTTTGLTLTLRRFHFHAQYALPVLCEAVFLLMMIVSWHLLDGRGGGWAPYFVAGFCFVMGLQNALVTKASSAIIRTTHITGMTTDLGIEIGKVLFGANPHGRVFLQSNAYRHLAIILCFFLGGISGAFGVKKIGVCAFLFIVALLVVVSFPPILRDSLIFFQMRARRKRDGRSSSRETLEK